jgi:hypothetical protein
VITTLLPEDIYGLGEIVSANNSRKVALIEEETRLKFFIDSVTVIGNVEFKQPDGTTKVSYQVGLGMTSNRAQRYEDNGEETGRNWQFFEKYTLSFSPKSNLVKSGLLQAADHDLTKVTLAQIIEGLVGKQISAMVKQEWAAHRDQLAQWEMIEGDEIVLNDYAACRFRNWLDAGYSVSKILKMMLSWDPHLTVPRKVRWTLQVYEEVIRQQGAIHNSAGHTVLPVSALILQLSSEQPLGFQAQPTIPAKATTHVEA